MTVSARLGTAGAIVTAPELIYAGLGCAVDQGTGCRCCAGLTGNPAQLLGHECSGAIVIGGAGIELGGASICCAEGVSATFDVVNDVTVAGAADSVLCIPSVPVMDGRGVGILHVAVKAVSVHDEFDNPANNLLLVTVQAAVCSVDAVIAYIVIGNCGVD